MCVRAQRTLFLSFQTTFISLLTRFFFKHLSIIHLFTTQFIFGPAVWSSSKQIKAGRVPKEVQDNRRRDDWAFITDGSLAQRMCGQDPEAETPQMVDHTNW